MEDDTLAAPINAKAEEIKAYKTGNPGLAKDDPTLGALVKELLGLKADYKAVTGKDFGPPPVEDKKKKDPVIQVGLCI